LPSLSEVLSSLTPADGGWRLEGAEGWTQGRTLYGGMTTALCAHVAGLASADLPPLRSAQVAFVGPAAGPLRFQASELRRGRSSAIVSVDCLNEDGMAARVMLTYGADRTSAITHDRLAKAAVPSPEACALFMPDRAPAGFFQNFEIRLAEGSRPFAGEPPEYLCWLRLLDPAGVDPQTALLAIADGLPPAAMAVFPQPGPISTMTWSIDFDRPLADEPWRLVSSSSEQARDGYSLQAMNVWDMSGRRIAAARQVVAIFV
jgi:acyl-CoA thioesterase